jgi:hypothetical protein
MVVTIFNFSPRTTLAYFAYNFGGWLGCELTDGLALADDFGCELDDGLAVNWLMF